MPEKNLHAGHREKLKNRFLKEGLDNFEDHNVLELILFYAIARKDVNEIAHRLLDRFGTLAGVFDAEISELKKVDGIGAHAAVLIKTYPAVTRRYLEQRFRKGERLPAYAEMGKRLVMHFAGKENEEVYALFFNNALNFSGEQVIHEGDVNSVGFSFRRLCDSAMKANASFVILAHNHPHGVPVASSDDLVTTDRLRTLLAQINVSLLDHFIVAEGRFSSIQDEIYHMYRKD